MYVWGGRQVVQSWIAFAALDCAGLHLDGTGMEMNRTDEHRHQGRCVMRVEDEDRLRRRASRRR